VYRTHTNRWHKVAYNGKPSWDARNEIIAAMIPAGSSVIDLGCGAQTLREHLPSQCSYQPCDLVKSTPDAIVCDFNKGQYPKSDKPYDYVVSSGVLEYIRNHDQFLANIAALGRNIILSYNPLQAHETKLQRMSNNWVNHFSKPELEQIFAKHGLESRQIQVLRHGELIYQFTRDEQMQDTQPPVAQHRYSTTRMMAKNIIIGHPSVSDLNGKAKLTSQIRHSLGTSDMWYSIPAEHAACFLPEQSSGFVVGLLHQAMVRNENIVTEGPISSRLVHSLNNFYIPMMAQAFPNLHPINILPGELKTEPTEGKGVATGCSGGIDSFATIVQHLINEDSPSHRISHLLFHNAGSHGHKNAKESKILFTQRLEKMMHFSNEVGIPLIAVDSNVAEVFPIDFIKMHHALNASILHCLQNKFHRYYYASTYKYMDCTYGRFDDIARYDPMAFHLLSTEGLDCISTGGQMSRTEKTRLVAEYEPSYRFLNVCVDPPYEGRNCSVCFKCCRTILTLEVLGLAHLYSRVFDLKKFNSVRSQYLWRVLRHKPGSFEREIANLIKARKTGPLSMLLTVKEKLGW